VPLDSVERAVADIATGRPVIVVDDADRENEGDIIVAASKMTPSLMAFMIRHTSGVICVPLTGQDLDRLQLPLMTAQNDERMRTAFTVSVDARDGVTTGISAADRARTVRVLVDSATEPYELVRPGHVFPLRYAEGGVLRRPGTRKQRWTWPGSPGSARHVLAEVVNDDGPGPGCRAAGVRGRARPGPDLDRAAHEPGATRAGGPPVETRLPNAPASGGPGVPELMTGPSTSRRSMATGEASGSWSGCIRSA
jgi:3,4-dihydroxy-2-butanone 4-phosphate synthase